ncbi:MAG: KOW domain-containing RNA-binding protein [Firmicutes bacterium]|nr:KOW domain-containing RNA-binding protein [[Eubacterium] siraeum]MCM1487554.1 KOW domain-containing RNA-binding protein [Bacillota bacterium]
MDFEKGTVVISKAGRDKGRFMAVIGEDKGYPLVADGKERPLERPKRKNPKHLQKTNRKIDLEQLTDKKLRTILRSIC